MHFFNWTFFIDRSCGALLVADGLRAAGEQVEIHDDHFDQDATDEEWLPQVSRRGWLALTKDSNIGKRTLQRLMVARHSSRLFVFTSGNISGSNMAEAVVRAAASMKKLAARQKPPFIAKIYSNGSVKLWKDKNDLLNDLKKPCVRPAR